MNDQELDIIQNFQSISGALDTWGGYVDSAINQLFKGPKDFLKIPAKHRVKSEKSYLYKVLYRSNTYIDPLKEIDDKVATRVVLLKSEDISYAQKLISQSNKWENKITKTIFDPIEDQPEVFNYQSFHIVVYPPNFENVLGVRGEYLGCEIQIRTLLQHAFAEISHDSTYKGTYRNDSEMIRKLSKSMALMEATDDYFCSVYKLMADQKRTYNIYLKELTALYKQFNHTFKNGELNIDLNNRLLSLLDYQNVEIGDLEAFVKKRHQSFKQAIKAKNGFLFQQPISLLLGYYLYQHESVLKEHWPLNNPALNNVYSAFGFSSGAY